LNDRKEYVDVCVFVQRRDEKGGGRREGNRAEVAVELQTGVLIASEVLHVPASAAASEVRPRTARLFNSYLAARDEPSRPWKERSVHSISFFTQGKYQSLQDMRECTLLGWRSGKTMLEPPVADV
jgi:hypothetical protein